MDYQDYYQTSACPRTASPGRDQEGVPQAGPRAPPRREARRHRRRAAVQGDQRGQRGPVRPGQAQASTTRSARTGRPISRAGAGAARVPARPAARSRGSAGARRPGGNVRYEFRTAAPAAASSRLLPDVLRRGRRRPPATDRDAARPRHGGRPAASRSRTSSPRWASTARSARRRRVRGGRPAGRPPRGRADRRGHRRDHARGGLPRHDPPGRGRGQAPRGHDPAAAPTPAPGSS